MVVCGGESLAGKTGGGEGDGEVKGRNQGMYSFLDVVRLVQNWGYKEKRGEETTTTKKEPIVEGGRRGKKGGMVGWGTFFPFLREELWHS